MRHRRLEDARVEIELLSDWCGWPTLDAIFRHRAEAPFAAMTAHCIRSLLMWSTCIAWACGMAT